MCTLVEVFSSCYDNFLTLSKFPDLFGKVFLITFKFSFLDFSTFFSEEQCKQNNLITYFLIRFAQTKIPLFISVTTG